jgi:hypothetical protein
MASRGIWQVVPIGALTVLVTACATPTSETQPAFTPTPQLTDTPEPISTPEPTIPPTATQEPTATPPPEYVEGEVLFEDDFELGYLAGWMVESGPWQVTEDVDGNHVLSIESPDWSSIFVGSEDWTDYAVEVRGRLGEPTPDAYDPALSFYVRSHPFSEGCQFYVAIYYPEGPASITKGGSGECNPWLALEWEDAPPVAEGWHSLRVEVFGSTIRSYRDGELVVEASDTELQTGSIGFFAPPGNTHYYDDVRVIELLPWSG